MRVPEHSYIAEVVKALNEADVAVLDYTNDDRPKGCGVWLIRIDPDVWCEGPFSFAGDVVVRWDTREWVLAAEDHRWSLPVAYDADCVKVALAVRWLIENGAE